ncbi:MAG: UDP-N-acetylmuramoyl-L-alanine--D-glutamate ligase [Patescibacteria group bacterium]
MRSLETLNRDSFNGQKVVVFGFGVNGGGLGTVEFLLGTKAASIIITDTKTKEELRSTCEQLPPDSRITWRLGGHSEKDFQEADIVIKNPGIRWDNPLILLAQVYGAFVLMDSTIFMALCEAPVIGITGSKGKTTTATLVAEILEEASHHVVRVGISQIGVLSELSKVTKDSVVVFEISSWRLSGLSVIKKSPSVSVITNLYPDHLNYYRDMEEYAQDKAQIFAFQDAGGTLVLPQRNPWTEYFAKQAPGQVLYTGNTAECEAWQDKERLYIRVDGEDTVLLEKKTSFLQGEYLFENFLAASLVARQYGVDVTIISKALASFRGVPHRFEFVRELEGVRYINDTAATIPSASLASVQSVTGPVILLAGGSDKELPLDELLEAINRAKFTILFAGSGTDKILALLDDTVEAKCQVVGNMEEAIQSAQKEALAGDAVLLAPGAASFGMFQNEFDRGDQFRARVLAL